MSDYYIAQSQSNTSQTPDLAPLMNVFTSPTGLGLLACGVGLGALTFLDSKGKKNKLARGRWGTATDRENAAKIALKQIEDKKHNVAGVSLQRPGDPSPEAHPIFLPNMERGCAIMGGPGTGKTFVGVLPIIYSFLDQSLPLVVYDFKYPDLTSQIVGAAAIRGYEPFIFAPGYPESHVCNPLSFIPRDDPSMMAAQFSEVLNRNFKKAGQKESDPFFSTAGDLLIQAIIMLALETPYPDLIMCHALLSLPNLTKRLELNKQKINYLTYTTFSALMASAKSEKTMASIVTVASNNFTSLMKPRILSAFCGKSTLPTHLQRKQIVIIGLDSELRDVLVPPCATLIDLLISRNVAKKRSEPMGLFVDEAPTINLPRIVNWLNEMRSRGLCTNLAFQNIVQMEQMYSKELTKAILGGCATKMVYNPQEYDSAKLFSDYLGQEHIEYQQKSNSKGKSGASTSTSDQNQARNLIDPADLLKFDQGERITISPGFKSRKEAYVPIRERVNASEYYQNFVKKSEEIWEIYIRQKLIDTTPQRKMSTEEMQLRTKAALEFLPLPEDNNTEDSGRDTPPEMKAQKFQYIPNLPRNSVN